MTMTMHRRAPNSPGAMLHVPATDPALIAAGITELCIADKVPLAWAERIVRAVNAHDELVAALRAMTHAYVGDWPMTQDKAAAGTRTYNAARALLARLDAQAAPAAQPAPAARGIEVQLAPDGRHWEVIDRSTNRLYGTNMTHANATSYADDLGPNRDRSRNERPR
ncbi:MAG: hypothetical protein ACK5XA_08420 [Tagaea sp.]